MMELVKRKLRFVTMFDGECSRCGRKITISADSSRKAEDELRMHGWKHLQMVGWICWECKEAQEEDSDVSND